MKLLTKEILKKVPSIEATAETSIAASVVVAKFFNPTGAGTWYMTAYDPNTNEAFGFVNLGDSEMAELGYFSMTELEQFKGRIGLGIERDRSFTSMPLQEVMDTIHRGGHI